MRKLSPVQIIFLGYSLLATVGTFFLFLPISRVVADYTFIDIFFTAVSAVCVTGLSVVDIASYFTLFGQSVILILIQFGGMGYMVLASIILYFFGKKMSLRSRIAIQDNYTGEMQGIGSLVVKVIKYTVFFELIGLVLIAVRFVPQFGWATGLYSSLFHAISAFCNAGVSLFSNNLVNYGNDLYLNLVFIFLIVLGGLGFIVIADIKSLKKFKFRELSLHSKIVLLMTAVLLLAGFLQFFFIENLSAVKALFLAATARTAGFSTIDIAGLKGSSLLFLMFLMFVGASPGGTGGGIKTTTIFTLLMVVWTNLSGREDICVMGRTITKHAVRKAMTVVFMYSVAFLLGLMIISDLEKIASIKIMFETFSAIGTVGLSMGVTSELSFVSQLILILLMLIGRIGPIAFGSALFNIQNSGVVLKYPNEKILIG